MAFNRTEADGRLSKAIGAVKEKLGRLSGNRNLEAEGSAERTAGGVRAGVGKAARKVNEAVNDAADDLTKPI